MIHSILIIGQSNMAGRGYIEDAKDVDTSRIKVLRNGRWQPMYRPVNCDRRFSGVCLAESFAESYVKKYDVEVGIIPCADGGTSLDQWQEGGLLFDNAVNNARLAMRTSNIAAVLWHQGEADCSVELYSTYYDRIKVMFEAMRRETGLYDVPFLVGGLGDFLEFCEFDENLKNYPYINAALRKYADDTPMTGFVSAEGLKSNPDNLHFCADALYEFGLRYFYAYEIYKNPDKVFEEKSDMDSAIRSKMEEL